MDSHKHDHGHAHERGHRHLHVDPEAGDRKVLWAIIVNLLLTVAQVLGGIFAGSLALIADALHNFSDAIAIIIAFGARKIARRPSNEDMTFGYARIETVAALVNYTTLTVLGLYLAYEAVMRFFEPQEVSGWLIVIIAGVALVIDLVTALLTYTLSKESMNIRAAFLHNVADALGSVAVIVAGSLILLFGWWIVDPVVTLMIAGYILYQAFTEIGPVMRILMLGSPPGIASEDVVASIRGVDGVAGIHHAHFWQMDENANALEAHLVIAAGRWDDAETVKGAVKSMLEEQYGIGHTTLETEPEGNACAATRVYGH